MPGSVQQADKLIDTVSDVQDYATASAGQFKNTSCANDVLAPIILTVGALLLFLRACNTAGPSAVTLDLPEDQHRILSLCIQNLALGLACVAGLGDVLGP